MYEKSENVVSYKQPTAQQTFSKTKVLKSALLFLISVGTVSYVISRKLKIDDLYNVANNSHLAPTLALAIMLLGLSILGYAWRLRLFAKGKLTWTKCLEITVLWQFCRLISPVSLGAPIVIIYILSKENLSGAEATRTVLYTLIQDCVYGILVVPLLLLFNGPIMIAPHVVWNGIDGWKLLFLIGYLNVFLTGGVLIVGVLFPRFFTQIINLIIKILPFKKVKASLFAFVESIKRISDSIRSESPQYHLRGFLITLLAMASEYIIVLVLMMGLFPSIEADAPMYGLIFARLHSMILIYAISPLAAGTGIAELTFDVFLRDILPASQAIIVVILWRALTYYPYLIFGTFIVPNWIRKRFIAQKNTHADGLLHSLSATSVKEER